MVDSTCHVEFSVPDTTPLNECEFFDPHDGVDVFTDDLDIDGMYLYEVTDDLNALFGKKFYEVEGLELYLEYRDRDEFWGCSIEMSDGKMECTETVDRKTTLEAIGI